MLKCPDRVRLLWPRKHSNMDLLGKAGVPDFSSFLFKISKRIRQCKQLKGQCSIQSPDLTLNAKNDIRNCKTNEVSMLILYLTRVPVQIKVGRTVIECSDVKFHPKITGKRKVRKLRTRIPPC